MKKKKQHSQPKMDDKPITLGDMLNQDLMKQLKGKKQELKEAEDKQKAEEEQSQLERVQIIKFNKQVSSIKTEGKD
jgi:hypothetical protein